MADAKISQLTALLTAADDDLLAIVDTSATETKKIAKSDLVAGLQAELVSGTNIKTINSTSLLGSGDISISASPAGTAGQIQFSDGSAFAADSNLYWDNTNKRLGVGTSTPASQQEIKGNGDQLWITNSGDIYTYLKFSAQGGFASMIFGDGNGTVNYFNNYATGAWVSNKFAFGSSLFTPSGQVHIKGSGSTEASTSLLVQNSSGLELFRAYDNGTLFGGNFVKINYSLSIGGGVYPVASAQLEMVSTTQGFLPPRMTTTQKNAISTPALGLQVVDTTTSRPCVYTSAWESLTSSDSASPTAVYKFWSGTAAQYAALTPDANTVYFVS